MGLHQRITDRVTSEPCDCGEDDDHGADEGFVTEGLDYTEADSEDQLVDYDLDVAGGVEVVEDNSDE